MFKRLFDVLVSGGALLVLSPIFLIIAMWIKRSSPGPVFYRGTRVGRHGKFFRLIKFRSMVVDAEKQGSGITVAGDSRVTQVGRVLRRTKLDELPQLINVLRGEMSIVGPRPEDPRYVERYTPEQRKVLDVRPGITSPASIHYRHEEGILTGEDWETKYIHEVMPAKLRIDLEYTRNPGLLRDIGLILRTITALFQ